jgi:hypothetical protein
LLEGFATGGNDLPRTVAPGEHDPKPRPHQNALFQPQPQNAMPRAGDSLQRSLVTRVAE